MEIHIRTAGVEIDERQESYIKNKLEVLQNYSGMIGNSDDAVQIWVGIERNDSLDQKQKVIMRVSMVVPRANFRAEVNALTPEEAIDDVHDKLVRQIKRYKDKHMHENVSAEKIAEFMQGQGTSPIFEGKDMRITKRKLFTDLFPMTETEAISHMKDLGHTFFIFVNGMTDRYNMIYTRPGGESYGLIELEHKEGVIGN